VGVQPPPPPPAWKGPRAGAAGLLDWPLATDARHKIATTPTKYFIAELEFQNILLKQIEVHCVSNMFNQYMENKAKLLQNL
jgi:hypothetical protein